MVDSHCLPVTARLPTVGTVVVVGWFVGGLLPSDWLAD